jgi:hypothetical protein
MNINKKKRGEEDKEKWEKSDFGNAGEEEGNNGKENAGMSLA